MYTVFFCWYTGTMYTPGKYMVWMDYTDHSITNIVYKAKKVKNKINFPKYLKTKHIY